MRVHLGSDHAGLDLKAHLLGWLPDHGHEPVDHGPFRTTPSTTTRSSASARPRPWPVSEPTAATASAS